MMSEAKKERGEIIEEIQEKRKSKLIAYVVSTRDGTGFQIADDVVRIIYNHLKDLDIEAGEKVDLFLHSLGGSGIVPWKLVNLIREFSENFEVIVPHKAYSAATLIALGANKIVMHRMGELGPVDPKVGNEFNPTTPQGQQIGINVEDVASYVAFIKEFVGITHEDELIQALNALTGSVHPLAIGNVHRFHAQSRMMAKKLLRLHMKDQKDEHTIEEISETLTSKLFFHGHPINRKEAIELKLKVEEPQQDMEDLIWTLYKLYEEEMEIAQPFIPNEILNRSGEDETNVQLIGSCVESERKEDRFVSEVKITRPPVPQNGSVPLDIQIQFSIGAISVPLSSGWQSIR